MLVVKGARVFAPADRGVCDVAVQQRRIVAVDRAVVAPSDATVVDASGAYLLPGLIDNHLHTIGGGGERGPGSRPGRMYAGTLIGCGITTAVGCLGFDGISRSVEHLYLHTLTLRDEGMSAFMLTGAFDVPPPTLTGNARRDVFLVEPVIGVGEIAIADGRSSVPTAQEIGRLASEAIGGGRLVGKHGYINLHLGEAPGGLAMVRSLIEMSGLPVERFLPTHVNRASSVLAEAAEFGRLGGFLDLTASITPADGYHNALSVPAAVERLTTSGIDLGRITVSSDSGGPAPARPDDRIGMIGQTTPFHLLRELRGLVSSGYGIDRAASFFTANVARALGMPTRGEIAVGRVADLLILNDDLSLRTVVARGRRWQPTGSDGAWAPCPDDAMGAHA